MTPELKQLLKRTAKEYGQRVTPSQSQSDRRRTQQRLYNQAQPLFTVLGFVLALFWLAPVTETPPNPNQTIQAGVTK